MIAASRRQRRARMSSWRTIGWPVPRSIRSNQTRGCSAATRRWIQTAVASSFARRARSATNPLLISPADEIKAGSRQELFSI
jgi:hypothetical protein